MGAEEALLPINAEAVEMARAESLAEAHLQMIVETFQALADPTRARILYALVKRPLCVRDLAILVGVSASGVSHQLRLLRDRRLVKPRRDGNTIYYQVDDHHVAALFKAELVVFALSAGDCGWACHSWHPRSGDRRAPA